MVFVVVVVCLFVCLLVCFVFSEHRSTLVTYFCDSLFCCCWLFVCLFIGLLCLFQNIDQI